MRYQKVFVSYDTSDQEIANRIASALQRIGIEPYLADRQIAAGMSLADKIAENIRDSNCFIPILTRNSLGSQWVNQEIGLSYSLKEIQLMVPIIESGLRNQIRGFLVGVEDIPLDIYHLDETIYRLITRVRNFINRNYVVLDRVHISCRKCLFPYAISLPTQAEINGVAERNGNFVTVYENPNCRTQNNLNPKTFEVIGQDTPWISY